MNKTKILGIDCGATKIIAQSCFFNNHNSIITPDTFQIEISYSDNPNFDRKFIPISIDKQKKEAAQGEYNISKEEIYQSDAIMATITNAIYEYSKNDSIELIGLCFPGIKTPKKDGISIMANGPRNIEFIRKLNEKVEYILKNKINIDKIYNDSDCCIIGEWKTSIGKLRGCKNAIYIGGGTGIADGLILNNKIVNLNIYQNIKKSWELIMPSGESVEQCLSLGGMINQWNSKNEVPVSGTIELFNYVKSGNEFAINIIKKAAKAFNYLLKKRIDFFQSKNVVPDKIIIGQRLGSIVSDKNNPLSKLIFRNKYNIEISTDRRTAALGAAYKAHDHNK